jgi:hypothetical protein
MLNTVKCDGSQPKTTAPAIRMMMAITVLNTNKDSTTDTMVTRQRHDSFVAETITGGAALPLDSKSIWHKSALLIPMFVSTELAVEWGRSLPFCHFQLIFSKNGTRKC